MGHRHNVGGYLLTFPSGMHLLVFFYLGITSVQQSTRILSVKRSTFVRVEPPHTAPRSRHSHLPAGCCLPDSETRLPLAKGTRPCLPATTLLNCRQMVVVICAQLHLESSVNTVSVYSSMQLCRRDLFIFTVVQYPMHERLSILHLNGKWVISRSWHQEEWCERACVPHCPRRQERAEGAVVGSGGHSNPQASSSLLSRCYHPKNFKLRLSIQRPSSLNYPLSPSNPEHGRWKNTGGVAQLGRRTGPEGPPNGLSLGLCCERGNSSGISFLSQNTKYAIYTYIYIDRTFPALKLKSCF